MDSIFEVTYMYPVTGAVQTETGYVWAKDAKEAILAVESLNVYRVKKEEHHFLEIRKNPENIDPNIEPSTREKWEKRLQEKQPNPNITPPTYEQVTEGYDPSKIIDNPKSIEKTLKKIKRQETISYIVSSFLGLILGAFLFFIMIELLK